MFPLKNLARKGLNSWHMMLLFTFCENVSEEK